MDFTHLRTFVAVAEEGHLTRAAERLHISQPAASAHIRALERSFDVVLFDRTPRGLELTEVGRALLQRAQQVLAEARAFTHQARQLSGQIMGSLVLGGNSDPAASRIAQIICRMREVHPLIALQVFARSSSTALQGVMIGELDAAFLIAHAVNPGLASLKLRRVNYCVAGPAHMADAIRAADWAGIARLPWITTARGNSYALMLDRLFGGRNLELNSVMEADNDGTIRALIAAGVGLSLVREDIAREAEQAGTMCIWPGAVTSTDLRFVYPRNRADDPVMRALVEMVKVVWPAAGEENTSAENGLG